MPEVLTFGEAMVSLRSSRALRLGGDVHLSVAGSESNVAIGLARLGHDVAWLGAVGNDEPGRLIQRTLRAENVDTSHLRFTDDSFTGFIAFDQPAHDITRVSYHRRGSAGSTLTAAECVAAVAPSARPEDDPSGTPSSAAPRILHVTGITPALSETARGATLAAVQAASAAGVQVSLDVNYRARLWTRTEAAAVLRELLPHVTTVFASDDELDILTDATDPVAALLSTGATEVVITAGSKGAWTHTSTGTIHQPALAVTVADSIGAGDAFVSGYLSATLDNLPTESRLSRATTTGAFCVGAHGDWESLPTREDLTLLTHTHGTALR
ncbi:sugar kinase [Streptomyces sp. SID13031]|uniref:sugar kinase n=1 Tax=Streptomyces sp. SID13031 TaxID=2706046 RepID=UPI0013CC156F|nr:sugar kinase [Streptomyces sp. SID13031]NEA33917.1 sugar kinase [Streptomyces sp. SID13031]